MQLSKIDTGKLIQETERSFQSRFAEIDEIAFVNQKRVLDAFRQNRITEEFFAERTGYGRDDPGRQAIDGVFAAAFEAESAAVRMQFVSGTHAIATALFGNLAPGQKMLNLTGKPYDTMLAVIGLPDAKPGTLRGLGVDYRQVDAYLTDLNDDQIIAQITKTAAPPYAVAYLQKSRGYSLNRRSLCNVEISRLIRLVKKIDPHCLTVVDNCYGEFVEVNEPTSVGADLIAGSLIKNPGGGLAPTGGYLAGAAEAIERALERLTAPGIGSHLGVTFNQNRLILQGLFLAPSTTSQALKGALLFAGVMEALGLKVRPSPLEPRSDIIQAIEFKGESGLLNFCRAIQRASPVNSHVLPEASEMSDYPDKIVMAAGTFIEGATSELSADGPLRPPYAGFLQGGLSYLHVKCALAEALNLSLSGEFPFI